MSSSLASQHSEWLSLVEISGPFLTLPVLKRALPLGLDPTPLPLVDDLRVAWKEVGDDDTLNPRWIRWVLNDLLELPGEVVKEGTAIGPSLTYVVPEHGVRLRPDFAIVAPESANHDKPTRMLVMTLPSGTPLDERLADSKWSADAIDRIAELCRGTGVRLGLVTNGEHWALVDAPVGGATGAATWDANLWLDERLTLDAFTTLLGVRRFFSVAETDTLEAMLAESANAEAEVTDQLGKQVRSAVELLVDAMSRANRDRGGHFFDDLTSEKVYEAAVTVMMRLVFLLSAEQRGLFLLGDETYDATYAVSTLRGQLEEEANTYGEEVIARRTDAWHRLLATFRMVFGGAQHENLRLPAYGGSLFDPDRFPFLEGRHPGEPWRSTPSNPLPIDNRTVLHILGALQILTFKDRRGVKEARRLSFRALDVEQIGHVYEGLLDHSAIRVDEVAVGFGGKKEPEIALELLEAEASLGPAHLVDFVSELTGLSRGAVEKALAVPSDANDLERLTSACDNDRTLADRIAPYLPLLRRDLADLPVVYLPNSMYVTQSSDRRSSGTYYTPRVLAEEMVHFALEPLVYSPGPADGAAPSAWVLKSSSELLSLKICDMAMGSGAFLVAACRYLSARLLEAWEIEGRAAGDRVPLSGDGSVAMPIEETDREILARRLVADACTYGVDRNPMAVEMAKLSMWLITLAKDRPFTFVDHALRCGDSLIGITELHQLDCFHLDPAAGRKLHGGSLFDPAIQIEPLVKAALEKRRYLESFPVVDVDDAARKRQLLEESGALLGELKTIGDLVLGAAIASASRSGDTYEKRLLSVAPEVAAALDPRRDPDDRQQRLVDLQLKAEYWLDDGRPPMAPDRTCFHWALEFPEVFLDQRASGFDALIGNPPFLGGVALAKTFGDTYERQLKRQVPESRGFVDLCSYFHRRANALVPHTGIVGLIGPQNLTATANLEAVGEVLLAEGRQVFWARKKVRWPGTASLFVCMTCYGPASWQIQPTLDGAKVRRISAALEGGTDVGAAVRLRPWLDYSQGTDLYGASFIKNEVEWRPFLDMEPALADYLRPYVNAKILCSTPRSRSDLLAVDFGEREKTALRDVQRTVAHLEAEVSKERANQTKQIHESRCWLHWDKRMTAYTEARSRREVIVCPNVSKHLPMLMVDSSYLFSKTVKFFPGAGFEQYAVLQSAPFVAWVFATSRLRGDGGVEFSSLKSLDTYVPPSELSERLRELGAKLWQSRAEAMAEKDIGITDLMNEVHDPLRIEGEIGDIRDLQICLDEEMMELYGWGDITLDYDFCDTPQGSRFVPTFAAREQMLQRILELNRQASANAQLESRETPMRAGRATQRARSEPQLHLDD